MFLKRSGTMDRRIDFSANNRIGANGFFPIGNPVGLEAIQSYRFADGRSLEDSRRVTPRTARSIAKAKILHSLNLRLTFRRT